MEEPKVIIEKGIPIPVKQARGGKFAQYFQVAKILEIGDSIVIPGAKRQQTYILSRCRDFAPKKYSTRMINENKLRLWRVE